METETVELAMEQQWSWAVLYVFAKTTRFAGCLSHYGLFHLFPFKFSILLTFTFHGCNDDGDSDDGGGSS